MPAYEIFRTTRPTTPDFDALAVAVRTASADATAGLKFVEPGAYSVKTVNALTPQLRAAVQAAIDSVAEFDAAVADVDDKALRAVVMGLWEAIPAPTMTKVQLRNRILQIYRSL